MNKTELIASVAQKSDLTKKTLKKRLKPFLKQSANP